MEEISEMFGGRRRGTEWSVPWPYKGMSVYDRLIRVGLCTMAL